MNRINIHMRILLLAMGLTTFAGGVQHVFGQEHRWLRIGELQSFFSDRGAEVEGEGYDNNSNFFSWPAQYGLLDQVTVRQKCIWIGCKNFYDTRLGTTLSYKVVGTGPRDNEERQNMIFEKDIRVFGKYLHPNVLVDDQTATHLATYEQDIEVDENLPCDRMIVIRFNTSIGVSVTKKVMAFSRSDHSNYFIYDYVFKNTGIINRDGDVHEQTLEDVYFYFAYRYAFAGESVSSYGVGWGANESLWGASTLNHAFGNNPLDAEFNNPNSPLYQMRAFYSFYGPNNKRTAVTYDEDWGCPNQLEDGVMSSAKYSGCVTLHADRNTGDHTDNLYQPQTTWYVSSDEGVWSASVSQIDPIYMQQRYRFMSEGDPPLSHADYIAANYRYAQEYEKVDSDRNVGGGASQGQGYGPYTMAPGDSVHIVFAEGVAGIGREKNREVGGNWVEYFKGTGASPLINPDGSVAADHNAYKLAWIETGVDSILKTYRNAIENFNAGYDIPQPPPPPSQFTVESGGDRIRLTWTDNAESDPHFGGYVIYRSVGNVMDPKTVYVKVFECGVSDVVNTWDDRTPARGNNYYYYIQSKDDGTQIGKTLYSGMYWTVTSVSAYLMRSPVPETPVAPADADSTSWKVSQGAWISGNDYNKFDVVSYYDLIYVCISAVSGDSAEIAPNLNMIHWRVTKYKGEWVSGAGYNVYDAVTNNGLIYVCLTTIPAGKGLEAVRVVPNPYDIRSRLYQFGTDFQYDRIVFYGLPSECKLNIFTERGDLIWEKYHDDGSGDEIWDSMTSSGQIIVSGIYILYVEAPDGRSVVRKFVVIR